MPRVHPTESGDYPTTRPEKRRVEQRLLQRSDVSTPRHPNHAPMTDGEIVRHGAARNKQNNGQAIEMRQDVTPSQIDRLTMHQLQELKQVTAREIAEPDRLTKRRLRAYVHKYQGQLAENALAKMGGISLNDVKGNFPVYDHLFKGESASVKTHMPNPKYENQHLSAYAHDLRIAIGAMEARHGKYAGKDGPSFAADQMKTLATADFNFAHVREPVVHQYLLDTATLRIPSDHVTSVKTYVERCAAQDPEIYGLRRDYREQDMRLLIERIKPVPITEQQIRRAVETRMADLKS